MNNLEKFGSALEIANFIGKALHGMATGRDVTKQDTKDAVDAVKAIAKLATQENRDATDFFDMLADATKNTMDSIDA